MTSEPTLDAVRAVVDRVGGAHGISGGAGPETRLTEGGYWLDSVQLLEAIIACEHAFGVVFDPATDFTDDNLRTVGTLCDLVRDAVSRRAHPLAAAPE
jgi:acyl carrier protein